MQDRSDLYARPNNMGWLGTVPNELRAIDDAASQTPKLYTRRPTQTSPWKDHYVKAVYEICASYWPGLRRGFSFHILDQFGGINLSIQELAAQIIGSCVASGAARAVAWRSLAEILIYGQAGERLMGRELTGLNSIVSFAPFNYGHGRAIGNLERGGDGSFCDVHIKSLQFGILDCNTAGLPSRLPEPDGRTYKEWGRNKFFNQFKDEASKIKLVETFRLTDGNDVVGALIDDHKPFMICSNWGFAPKRYLPEYMLWEYERSGSWAHNMTVMGVLEFESGAVFVLIANTWPKDAHKPMRGLFGPNASGSNMFAVPLEVFVRWVKDAVSMATGELQLKEADDVPRTDPYGVAV